MQDIGARNWSQAHEWLEADGLGGFASGCVDGTRSRRYHALLLAARGSCTQRSVLVQSVEAWIWVDGERLPLSSSVYTDGVTYPDARGHLKAFHATPWPRWTLEVKPGLVVEHEVFVPRGHSAVVLSWRLSTPRAGCHLEVRPLLSGRDLHALHFENASFDFTTRVIPGGVSWTPYDAVGSIHALSNGTFRQEREWYRNFLYTQEQARGFDHHEDLASPGTFAFDLSDQTATLIFGTPEALVAAGQDAAVELASEWARTESLRRANFHSPMECAGQAYIVQRGAGATIIAGYPWFGDWGRDTFIALRGLCLATGRTGEARSILLEWAGHVSEGMLPNRFPDGGGEPEYNSVDAALWFVIGVYELEAALQRQGQQLETADRQRLGSAVEQILDAHLAGTRHGIAADTDGLLRAGAPGVQLTWMDARADGKEITPRCGKPVEIQALWLNALWIGSCRHSRFRRPFEQGRRSFGKLFWNESRGCLYDVIDVDHMQGHVDASLRPNQLLAIGGLPLQLVKGARAKRILELLEERLWTPIGPRSLDPSDPRYVGRYEGGPRERDAAYHQGAVWPWLAGAFVEAWVRVHGCDHAARRQAREVFLRPLLEHLDSAGIGHASELADGDAPHTPRGCPFQAWSLGELLRLDRLVLADPDGAFTPRDSVACEESESESARPPTAEQHPAKSSA